MIGGGSFGLGQATTSVPWWCGSAFVQTFPDLFLDSCFAGKVVSPPVAPQTQAQMTVPGGWQPGQPGSGIQAGPVAPPAPDYSSSDQGDMVSDVPTAGITGYLPWIIGGVLLLVILTRGRR
jgi:hypothetical protein